MVKLLLNGWFYSLVSPASTRLQSLCPTPSFCLSPSHSTGAYRAIGSSALRFGAQGVGVEPGLFHVSEIVLSLSFSLAVWTKLELHFLHRLRLSRSLSISPSLCPPSLPLSPSVSLSLSLLLSLCLSVSLSLCLSVSLSLSLFSFCLSFLFSLLSLTSFSFSLSLPLSLSLDHWALLCTHSLTVSI